MIRSLSIAGAGGHGRVVADTALAAGWQEVLFYDDRYPALSQVDEWRVAGTLEECETAAGLASSAIAGIGDNTIRCAFYDRLSSRGIQLATVVHPHSWVSPRAEIGPGSVIFAGGVVNIGAKLERGVIINTGATVDHDCRIGDCAHIAPGAHLSGEVIVGAGAWIGVGACVRQGISIGPNAVIGAGAVVVSDVPAGVVAFGNPSRQRKG